jgi:hypothetical protein
MKFVFFVLAYVAVLALMFVANSIALLCLIMRREMGRVIILGSSVLDRLERLEQS